ncbi:MAG: hypothetical protein AABW84_02550 [Nanoarchaeota archaeon]
MTNDSFTDSEKAEIVTSLDAIFREYNAAAKVITIDDMTNLSPEILKQLGSQLDLRMKLIGSLDYLKSRGIIDDKYYDELLATFDEKSKVVYDDTNYVQSNILGLINPLGDSE